MSISIIFYMKPPPYPYYPYEKNFVIFDLFLRIYAEPRFLIVLTPPSPEAPLGQMKYIYFTDGAGVWFCVGLVNANVVKGSTVIYTPFSYLTPSPVPAQSIFNMKYLHNITLKIVSHYPLIRGEYNYNAVNITAELYWNNYKIYSGKFNWTYPDIPLYSLSAPQSRFYVNITVKVISFPRIILFKNVSLNIGIALLNNTTSAIITEERIRVRAPSILALIDNFSNYLLNTIISNPSEASTSNSSVIIVYNNVSMHTAWLPQFTQPIGQIIGTIYNYTNVLGPYQCENIAITFSPRSPISPNECYMIVIDTDKGPIILRNNGVIIK